jgi:hypothetical protein
MESGRNASQTLVPNATKSFRLACNQVNETAVPLQAMEPQETPFPAHLGASVRNP